jgi:hypothetical protein
MMGEHSVKLMRDAGLPAHTCQELVAEGAVVSTSALMKGMSAQMAAAGDAAGAAKAAKGAKAFGLIERLQSGPTFDYAYPPIKPELEKSVRALPGRSSGFSIP